MYDHAFRNAKRGRFFGRRSYYWDRVCRRLAAKLEIYHHPWVKPRWMQPRGKPEEIPF